MITIWKLLGYWGSTWHIQWIQCLLHFCIAIYPWGNKIHDSEAYDVFKNLLAFCFLLAVLDIMGERKDVCFCQQVLNTLRLRENGRHFADDIFKCIFFNENVWIPIKISLKFVPKGPINNIPALVQIMAWHRPGDKPLSEPTMVSLLTHICVTRPQWVKTCYLPLMLLWTQCAF